MQKNLKLTIYVYVQNITFIFLQFDIVQK